MNTKTKSANKSPRQCVKQTLNTQKRKKRNRISPDETSSMKYSRVSDNPDSIEEELSCCSEDLAISPALLHRINNIVENAELPLISLITDQKERIAHMSSTMEDLVTTFHDQSNTIKDL